MGKLKGGYMQKTTTELAKDFIRALEMSEDDPCYSLNFGLHEVELQRAWKALKRNVERGNL
jgi:hypothetical protein